MGIIKGLITIIYLVVYVYSVQKTIIEPKEIIWGYICVIICIIAVIYGMLSFKSRKKLVRKE